MSDAGGPSPTEVARRESQLITLYQTLRSELLQADSLNYQIIGVAVAATAALMTTAVAQKEALNATLMFMSVYVVTIPAYLLLLGNRRRTWRISSFLRVCVEPHLDWISWETGLDRVRRADPETPRRRTAGHWASSAATTNEWLITSLLTGVATILAVTVGVPGLTVGIGVRIALGIGLLVVLAGYLVVSKKAEAGIKREGPTAARFHAQWTALHPELYRSAPPDG